MFFFYENVQLQQNPRFFLSKTCNCSKIHSSDANLPLDGPRDHIFIDLARISCFCVNLSVDFLQTFHLHFHMCFLLFSFLSVGLQGNIRKARPQREQYSQIVVGAAMTRHRRLQYTQESYEIAWKQISPKQACLKGFSLSLIRNPFWCSGPADPPEPGSRFPQCLDASSPCMGQKSIKIY